MSCINVVKQTCVQDQVNMYTLEYTSSVFRDKGHHIGVGSREAMGAVGPLDFCFN